METRISFPFLCIFYASIFLRPVTFVSYIFGFNFQTFSIFMSHFLSIAGLPPGGIRVLEGHGEHSRKQK